MAAYWILLFAPALQLVFVKNWWNKSRPLGLYIFGSVLTIFIGLRYNVGCDWLNYQDIYYRLSAMSLPEAMRTIDPAYAFLNWVSDRLGLGIYGANFVCAAIFCFGLIRFALRQPLPYVFLVTAFPMLITTVAMGQTRQATAIGLLMLAFNAFVDRRIFLYIALVFAASLFHSTAVIFIVAGLFLAKRRVIVPVIAGAVLAAVPVFVFMQSQLQQFINLYIQSEVFAYEGGGAAFRIYFNGLAIPAYMLVYRQWKRHFQDGRLYTIFLAISSLSFFALTISAVAADRMALYFMPLQAAVFARVPLLLGGKKWVWPLAALVIFVMSMFLWIWFKYATHSVCWVPYRNIIAPSLWGI